MPVETPKRFARAVSSATRAVSSGERARGGMSEARIQTHLADGGDVSRTGSCRESPVGARLDFGLRLRLNSDCLPAVLRSRPRTIVRAMTGPEPFRVPTLHAAVSEYSAVEACVLDFKYLRTLPRVYRMLLGATRVN